MIRDIKKSQGSVLRGWEENWNFSRTDLRDIHVHFYLPEYNFAFTEITEVIYVVRVKNDKTYLSIQN